MEMTEKDLACFKHFLAAYQNQYKLNNYARDNYDEDLEFYTGYRNKAKYPLAYNMVFNKLLPRSQNVLARFMEQIYQGGIRGVVSVRPRKRTDVERAPKVEGLLNYQLETLNEIDEAGGGYWHNFMWMFNALNWGVGVSKLYWKKEERITPRRLSLPLPQFDAYGNVVDIKMFDALVEQSQTVYNQPYAEVLHNKCFVPHPHYKSIQKMPFVFCVYNKSIDYVKSQADRGNYKKQYIKNLGWEKRGSGNLASGSSFSTGLDSGQAFAKSLEIEGAYFGDDDLDSDKMSPNVDIIEGYGRYIFPEDETPYEVGSGYKIKGKESEAICHIGNYKTLLSIQKNKYGVRPFFKIGAYYHPELFWDIGLIRLGKGIQEQYNTLGNTRFQNAIMGVNQMLKVREDADIDPAALVWKPYGILPVEEMDDVEPLVVPDMSQTGIFREQEEFFDETLSEMTGETAYNLGQTPQRQEYVGTIQNLMATGMARAKLLLMTMDYTGFQPFLKHMMRLNVYHLPTGFEARITDQQTGNDGFVPLFSGDIHFDYDFTARYTAMEPALGKMFRAQQLMQYAQMWAESPYLQHYQFMKSVLEMLDFHDSDRYLYTPQQVQAMQQQQAQQAAQMELMGAQIQDHLASNEAKRQLERDVVKGLLK